jgi:hypothetical protein
MLNKLFVAVDRFESRHHVIDFVSQATNGTAVTARVFHGIEFAGLGCAAPLDTRDEAALIVEEAVFKLRMAGIGCDGLVRLAVNRDVGVLVLEEANRWGADAIVVGARRRRAPTWLFGRGVREQIIRRSTLPVLVAPDPHELAHRPVGSQLHLP